MKRTIIWALLAAAICIAAGTGCRTAHGFGEDLENAGNSIQHGTGGD